MEHQNRDRDLESEFLSPKTSMAQARDSPKAAEALRELPNTYVDQEMVVMG